MINEKSALTKIAQNQNLVKQEEKRNLIQESIDGLNQWLIEERSKGESLSRVSFGNIDVSIQASKSHYSTPRSDNVERYTHVELGYPSETPPDYILEYAEDPDNPTETVYPHVPIEKVVQWAAEKGGMRALSAPEKNRE